MERSAKKLPGDLPSVHGDARFNKLMLDIAIKLYARARRISIDDATDNVRDAAMMSFESGYVPDEEETP